MNSETTTASPAQFIKGADLIIAYFGRWPSFHDAEILRVEMSRVTRPPYMVLELYTFLGTQQIDERGHYKLTHRSSVTFLLEDIQEVELEGFNTQNVIFGLTVERKEPAIEVTLRPCFGLSGRVVCRSMEVLRVEPLPE